MADPSPPTQPLDWDDLRFALAVAEAGSLNAAAQALGVRHSTVLRRLDALEARLGTRLFDRLRSGYRPTDAGELLAEHARRVRPEIDALQRRLVGRDLEPSGSLRLNTSYIAMLYLLPQALAGFARAHPRIEVEVAEASALVDLSRRDADVALRLSRQVPEHLVGRRLGEVDFAFYAARGATDLPQQVTPLPTLLAEGRFIGFERDRSARFFECWALQHLPPERIVFRVDIFQSVLAMTRTGLGLGLLPHFVEAAEPGLLRVSEPIPALRTPLWLLTHPDLRGVARLQAFTRHLAAAITPQLRRSGAGADPGDGPGADPGP
jgi:DNA-binding transcriptional LysR family regulator